MLLNLVTSTTSKREYLQFIFPFPILFQILMERERGCFGDAWPTSSQSWRHAQTLPSPTANDFPQKSRQSAQVFLIVSVSAKVLLREPLPTSTPCTYSTFRAKTTKSANCISSILLIWLKKIYIYKLAIICSTYCPQDFGCCGNNFWKHLPNNGQNSNILIKLSFTKLCKIKFWAIL